MSHFKDRFSSLFLLKLFQNLEYSNTKLKCLSSEYLHAFAVLHTGILAKLPTQASTGPNLNDHTLIPVQ